MKSICSPPAAFCLLPTAFCLLRSWPDEFDSLPPSRYSNLTSKILRA
jgi:hypothetical protein